MDVELLVIPGCPGGDEATALLHTALDDIGLGATPFIVGVIDSVDAAQARGFLGSPAFLVDGVDLFATDDDGGSMACRVYSTPEGPRNVPDVRDLRKALERHAATRVPPE